MVCGLSRRHCESSNKRGQARYSARNNGMVGQLGFLIVRVILFCSPDKRVSPITPLRRRRHPSRPPIPPLWQSKPFAGEAHNEVTHQAGLRRSRQFAVLLVYDPDEVLNGIHLGLFKRDLPALLANPRRNLVETDVNVFPVDMKWRTSTHQFTLTIHAFHGFTLALKSLVHCTLSGIYAAITAKYSSFGAHTIWIGHPFPPLPRIRQLCPLESSG
jgi:hypothetical protein